jgi:hypothetical protein
MFSKSEKVFIAYEKPEAAEPTDRVVLVREGFSVFAFVLNIIWMLMHRAWLIATIYLLVLVGLMELARMAGLSSVAGSFLQLGLNLMVGFHAADIHGHALERRGYRAAGIIVAPSPVLAERRYYEHAV